MMSSNDISISFTDEDHLTVALPDTQLTNGLDLAVPNMHTAGNSHTVVAPSPHLHTSGNSESRPIPLAVTAVGISATTTSLSMPSANNHPTNTPSAATTNSRFKVQPTDTAVLVRYDRSQNTTVHSNTQNTHYKTSSSTPQYQNSTAVQPNQPIKILTRNRNSDSNVTSNSTGPQSREVRRVNSENITTTHQQLAENGAPNSAAQKRKRVSFPDGQALIKGFAHAPNPWYNGKLNIIYCRNEFGEHFYEALCYQNT